MAETVDQKLLKATKFPSEFSQKVDMQKVNLEVMKAWITGKMAEILGSEDDVVTELCYNLLKGSRFPDIRVLQIQLTGFLDKDTAAFCKELWTLCLSAQSNPQGVPKELLEAKKLELKQQQARIARPIYTHYLILSSRPRLRKLLRRLVDAVRRKEYESATLRTSDRTSVQNVAEAGAEEVTVDENTIADHRDIRGHLTRDNVNLMTFEGRHSGTSTRIYHPQVEDLQTGADVHLLPVAPFLNHDRALDHTLLQDGDSGSLQAGPDPDRPLRPERGAELGQARPGLVLEI